jgi:hypothetical protein
MKKRHKNFQPADRYDDLLPPINPITGDTDHTKKGWLTYRNCGTHTEFHLFYDFQNLNNAIKYCSVNENVGEIRITLINNIELSGIFNIERTEPGAVYFSEWQQPLREIANFIGIPVKN